MGPDMKRERRGKDYPIKPLKRYSAYLMVFLVLWSIGGVADAVNRGLGKIAAAVENEKLSREARTHVDPALPVGAQSGVARWKMTKTCREALAKLKKGESADSELKDIAALSARFEKVKAQSFAATAAVNGELVSKKMPAKILARQAAYRRALVKKFNELSRLVDRVGRAANDPAALAVKVRELLDFLEPGAVAANGKPQAGVISSSTRRAAAKSALRPGASPFFSGKIELAAAGDTISGVLAGLEGQAISGQPVEADLAATPDIVLDGTIAALAAALNNDPVKIYEYVRNNVAYEPYFGALKGARQTLLEKAGNDFDQASLLMALLRASGVSCRYVFGTIQLPIADAGAWVGADDPNQIARIFIANGVPVETIQGGGAVSALKLDHVWVKAYVDYFPYRGAANAVADTWVELDPSFKQNAFTAGRDIVTRVGLDPMTFLANIKANSVIAANGDYAANIPEAFVINELFSYAPSVRDYLAANNLTAETVFRQRVVTDEKFGVLPVTDQYRIVARGLSFSALPDALRQRLSVALKDGATAAFNYETSLPALAGKRVAISYRPETTDDLAVIAAYAESDAFPVYLVSLVPELTIDGQTVATGPALTMGETQDLELTFSGPNGTSDVVTDQVVVGSVNALTLDFQNAPAAALDTQRAALDNAAAELAANNAQALSRDNTLGDALRGVGLSYFHQADRFNQIAAGSLDVAVTRKPSLARVAWDLSVTQQFGLPFTAAVDRVKINVARDAYVPVAIRDDNRAAENQFVFTAALTGRALEHNALSQPFLTEAASAARAIQKANADGDKIYSVTAANAATVLPELVIPAAAAEDILDAVNAGMVVTAPEKTVWINGAEYYAYVKRDPDTNASKFVLGAITGGEQVNTELKAADLLTFGSPTRYLAVVNATADWLKVAENATTNAGLSYLPAIVSVNSWFQNVSAYDPVTTVAAIIAVSGPITKIANEPAILNAAADQKAISPNADGVKDALTVTADVTRGAAWTVNFKNSSGAVVHTQSGTVARLSAVFDQNVPSGTYAYEITAAAGGVSAAPVSGSFKVDIAPPTAEISAPVAAASVKGKIMVSGSADDLNFQEYALSLQASDTAAVELFKSSDSVVGGTLFAFDTAAYPNGPAALTLNVTDQAGNKTAAVVNIVIANPERDTAPPTVSLAAAAGGQAVNSGDTVTANVNVAVTAADNVGVAKVALSLDGAAVAESASGVASLNHLVELCRIADGPHILTAAATDSSGNVGTSSNLNFVSSGTISGFKVAPSVATLAAKTVKVSANLRAAADWTLSFSGPGAIPSVTGSGTSVSAGFDASSYADGAYTVTLNVAGLSEQPSLPFAIDVQENPTVAAIGNIAESQIVREGLFELVGTAYDPDLSDAVKYRVELLDREGNAVADLTPKPVDDQGWKVGKVQNGPLGTLDFTMVQNGCYALRLTVDGGGETQTAEVNFALNSQLKVGQMGFSQQDMVIPAGGQPLTVIRTYNSLNANNGDFGYSWTWAIKDVEMTFHEDRGTQEDLDGVDFSLRTGGSRDVDVTLPDGRRVTFAFEFGKPNASNPFAYQAYWKAAPGVRATLTPTCSNRLIALYGGLQYWEAAGMDTPVDNFDFPGFVLTMADGSTYLLEREDLGEHMVLFDDGSSLYSHAYGAGTLKRIALRSGETTVFNDASIDCYNAQGQKIRSVVFHRGTNGLIDAIYDPKALDNSGNPVGPAYVTYEYDANDNLVKVNKLQDGTTDPANPVYLTTEYLYEEPGRPNFITSIKDPRGLTPMISEYDASGRLIATVDASGNRVEMTHNLAAKSETVIDRQGNATVYGYDARGNVVSSTDAQGNTTYHSYDNEDNELSVTDPLGNVTSYEYDANGNRTSVTDPLGNTSRYTYDSYGNQLTSTDALGNVTTNNYDANGNLVSTTNALGQTTSNSYDNNGNLAQTKDALGRVTATFGYDGNGNMTSTTDAAGFARSFSYNANGEQTGTSYEWQAPDGSTKTVTTQTIYDDAGQVVKTVDPEGNATLTEYNAIGKPTKTTDKLGNVTVTVYDARGNVIETQYPDGTISRTVYDANGRAFCSQDRHVPGEQANGAYTFYDSVGRVVKTQRLSNVSVNVATGTDGAAYSAYLGADAVISQTSTVYDRSGRVLKSTDASGAVTRYEYDAAGRTTAVIDALGNRTEYEFNDAGQQTLVRDALDRETQFFYDALGRRIKTVFPDGTYATVGYNELGQKIRETDQSGLTTQFSYDTLGRLANVAKPEVANPENNGELTAPQWAYAYDKYGRLTTITDPKGRATGFTYDALGRQLTRTLPMGQSESQQYDTLGRLSKKIDFKGQVTTLGYDALGRIETQNFNNAETVTMTYDDLGREKTVTDARGITEYAYDSDGRVISVATPEGTIHYEYDQTTGRKTKTWTANSDVGFGYDTLGRLSTVTVNKRNGAQLTTPEVTTYEYTAVGSRAGQVLPNGVKTTYEYNELNRLTALKHFSQTDQLLASYEYTLLANGRRAAVAEQRLESDSTTSTTNIAYSYDKLNRLVAETATSTLPALARNHSYAYDLVGNRLKKTTDSEVIAYTYNNNDQLIQESSNVNGASDYAYDANGSLTSKVSTNGDNYAYTWDARNRLAAATISRMEGANSVQISAQYAYNHSGIRSRALSTQTINGVTSTNNRYFLVDEQNHTGYAQVMEESTSLGAAPLKTYTLGDDIISQSVSGAVSHLLYDGHGSTRLLAANSGVITDRFDYDAYGIQLSQTPNVTTPGSTDMLYSGEQFDHQLNNYYLRARYFDQNVGRFNSLDPFAGNNDDPQSLHKYAYTHCDPINGIDPSGLSNLTELQVVNVIQLVLFSILVAAAHTSIQVARGMRGWDIFFNFIQVFGVTLVLTAGGVSDLVFLQRIAIFAGYALLAYAIFHYGKKVATKTFDRWDAAELLLFVGATKAARALDFMPGTRTNELNLSGEDFVVFQHGTTARCAEQIVREGPSSALVEDGVLHATPTSESMPQNGIHASIYATNKARHEGGDPAVVSLIIPRNFLGELLSKGKPSGGDEYFFDATAVRKAYKEGKIAIQASSARSQ